MKLKTNDIVKVLSGKDRGKTGKIIQVFPQEERAVVEGVNKIKKHLRAKSQSEKGQVLELFAPLHMSKVQLVCPKCNQAIRVHYKLEAGKKRRVCSRCGELID